MSDQNLTCTDCGKQFTFTESEQEFYQSKEGPGFHGNLVLFCAPA